MTKATIINLTEATTNVGAMEDINTNFDALNAELPVAPIVTTTDIQTLTNKTLTSPGITTPTGIVKGDVGLGNVDNTSDATKNTAVATLTNKTLTSPTLTTPALGTPASGNLANCTFPTLNQSTTGTAAIANALKSATTTVNVSSATAPTVGQVLTATGGSAATWQTPTSAGPTVAIKQITKDLADASTTTTYTHTLGRAPIDIIVSGDSANGQQGTGYYINSTNYWIGRTLMTATYSIFLGTASNGQSGVIQNLTSTNFDIAWTKVGGGTGVNNLMLRLQ